MNKKDIDKLIKNIKKEVVEYNGLINFASKGIEANTNGLIKAFKYGVDVGVECMKKDAIRIILKEI